MHNFFFLSLLFFFLSSSFCTAVVTRSHLLSIFSNSNISLFIKWKAVIVTIWNTVLKLLCLKFVWIKVTIQVCFPPRNLVLLLHFKASTNYFFCHCVFGWESEKFSKDWEKCEFSKQVLNSWAVTGGVGINGLSGHVC